MRQQELPARQRPEPRSGSTTQARACRRLEALQLRAAGLLPPEVHPSRHSAALPAADRRASTACPCRRARPCLLGRPSRRPSGAAACAAAIAGAPARCAGRGLAARDSCPCHRRPMQQEEERRRPELQASRARVAAADACADLRRRRFRIRRIPKVSLACCSPKQPARARGPPHGRALTELCDQPWTAWAEVLTIAVTRKLR